MVTVSLQPFALRKIVLLIAAVIWLTATVVFADPVFMNGHAMRAVHRSHSTESASYLVAEVRTAKGRDAADQLTAQIGITPAEGPTVFSASLEQVETWNAVACRPFSAGDELTFWSVSLSR